MIITWKNQLMDIETQRKPDYYATSLYLDSHDMVSIVIENGLEVKQVKITIETAQQIGLINLSKLSEIIK